MDHTYTPSSSGRVYKNRPTYINLSATLGSGVIYYKALAVPNLPALARAIICPLQNHLAGQI